jgi:hypothetical protein
MISKINCVSYAIDKCETGLENRRGGDSTVGSNPTPSANINDLSQNEPRAWRASDASYSGSLRHKTRHSLFTARSGRPARQPKSEPL